MLLDRIIISFNGVDWRTKLAPFISDKIKQLPRTDRKWLFTTKSWSIDAIHSDAIDSWIKEYWDNYKPKSKAAKKNEVDASEFNVDNWLEQFN